MNQNYFLAIMLATATLHSTVSAHIFEGISIWWQGKEEEVITHEHVLTPGAHISIENPKGDITISTWNQNKVMLEVTKIGSEKSVEHTKVDLTYTKHGVSIKTVNVHPEEICRVSLSLIVPSDAILDHIKTDRGNITVKNCVTPVSITSNYGNINIDELGSSANIYTKHGSITLSTVNNLAKEHKIVAFTERGTITLSTPEETNGHLYATTLRGNVSTEQPVTLDARTMPINKKTIAQLKKEIQGSFGSGDGPNIKLHTNNGNIKVTVS